MIEVSLTGFFGLVLVVIFVAAAASAYFHRRREHRAARALRRLMIRCRVCGSAYRATGGSANQRCPHCGRENPAGRDRRLG
ncbi:MAG: hypothetical protein HKN82_13320 [Akkermansiaceae bacterium]|nr:hypothetical protein [Akkermansiaceae bacterium]